MPDAEAPAVTVVLVLDETVVVALLALPVAEPRPAATFVRDAADAVALLARPVAAAAAGVVRDDACRVALLALPVAPAVPGVTVATTATGATTSDMVTYGVEAEQVAVRVLVGPPAARGR